MTPTDPLDRLLRDLGWTRLDPVWAKAEILLGLFAAASGLMGGMALAGGKLPEVPPWAWFGPVLLITLGGYLALAGHRSHLYQSNNRLAAYLAETIRTQQPPPPSAR